MKTKEELQEERINWADIAKGIGIVLVLLGHAPRDIMRMQYPLIDFLYYFIYSFHMPLFFFLSGMIFGNTQIKKPSKSFFAFLKKKVRALLIPWLSFSILIYLVIGTLNFTPSIKKMLQGTFMEGMDIHSYVKLCIGGENPYCIHLWYIYTLFFIQIFVFLIFRLYQMVTKRIAMSHRGIRILGSMAIIIFLLMPGSLPVCVNIKSYLIYYVLGINCAYGQQRIKMKFSLWMIVGVLLCAANALVVNMNKLNLHMMQTVIYHATAFIGVPIMILFVCSLAKKMEKNRWLLWLGKNSFGIYLLHQPFCCAVLGTMFLMVLPYKLVSYLAIMAVCIMASVIFPFGITELAWRLKLDTLLKTLFGVERMRGVPWKKDYDEK